MRDYLRIAFDRVPIAADRREPLHAPAQKCISLPARWRLDHERSPFPVELWINDKLKERTAAAMKPVVDAKRLEPVRNRWPADARQSHPVLSRHTTGRHSARRCACCRWPSSLRQADFEVVMIDAAIEPDYQEPHPARSGRRTVPRHLGADRPMIRGAIEVATAVKEQNPKLPVIFGGWHPSLLPDETLNEPSSTWWCAARARSHCGSGSGAGRRTIARRNRRAFLEERRSPQAESERRVQPLDSLPMPAFDLVDFDAYERLCGVRKLAYATSVGCPYACNYCTDMVFYKRRFNALSAERVVGELAAWSPVTASKKSRCSIRTFPSICAARLRIARGIIESGVKFRWTFQASTDFLCRMSEDEVRLLGESGVSHMGFGTESTSEPC